MTRNIKTILLSGMVILIMFGIWTVLIQTINVQPIGQNGTNIGFADMNVKFHELNLQLQLDLQCQYPQSLIMQFFVLPFKHLIL